MSHRSAVHAAMMITVGLVYYLTLGITRVIVSGSAWAGRRYRARRARRPRA